MAARLHLNHRQLQRWRRPPSIPRSPGEVALPADLGVRLSPGVGGDRVRTAGLARVGVPELELVRVRPELRHTARRLLPLAARELVWRVLEAGSRPLVLPDLWLGQVEGCEVVAGLTSRPDGSVRLHPPGRPRAAPTRLLQRAARLFPPHDHARLTAALPLPPREVERLRHRFHQGADDARWFLQVGAPTGAGTAAAWVEVVRWTERQILGRAAAPRRAPWGARWGERVVAPPDAVLAWRVDHLDGRVEGGPHPGARHDTSS